MGRGQDDLGRLAPCGAGDRVLNDTIFALSSGRAPAAVAVIRTSGPRAFAAAETIAGKLPPPRKAVLRTLRDPLSGEPIDDALVLRFEAPGSATGENVVEYQCHGGRAVVDALLGALASQPGMRAAEPGEFTRRAFHNGRIDLTEAEGLADLLEAETESQRRAALRSAEGGVRRQVEAWRSRAIDLSARAEAAIDYVGDEDETAVDAGTLVTEASALADELSDWLARPRVEVLKHGVRVVVAGPPNAGKSSLVNALGQSERAIVTDVEGTTRDVIEVPLAIDGVPFVLVDTAGLRDSEDRVEKIGIDRAKAELQRADVLLWLGDPSLAPPGAVIVHSKADLAAAHKVSSSLMVSAVTGMGVARLAQHLAELARGLLPAEDEVAFNRRQANELAIAQRALSCLPSDLVIVAESLRHARSAFDRITGQTGVEEMLDALFGRFCLGK